MRHLFLPKTSLGHQIDEQGYAIQSETDGIRFDVSGLERGLYYLSIKHDSDYPLAGPRVTVARPAFETSDHIYTFVRRDQREFFGTVLIVNEIEALVFYPSKLPCHLQIHSITLRRINSFARDYIYGQTFVRCKLFGLAWTWDRIREDSWRAVSRLVRGGSDDSYATWWRLHGARSKNDLEQQSVEIRSWESAGSRLPTFSLILPVYRTSLDYLVAAVDSVRAQTYTHWQLCICDDFSEDALITDYLNRIQDEDSRICVVTHERNRHISAASNSALQLAEGEFVAFLDHDDSLEPDALYEIAAHLRENPATRLVYSDEDVIDADGQPIAPHFKPDWNYDLFRCINYVCHFLVVAREAVNSVGGLRQGYEGAQDFDLVLRLTEEMDESEIHHIPRVLYHWRAAEGSTAQDVAAKPYAMDAGLKALADHVVRRNLPARAEHSEIPTAYRLRYDVPEPVPSVSILIPTHNGLRVLRNCIDKLLARTDYPDYELVVIDNRSDDPETLDYLSSLDGSRVRILRYDAPFNFSAINNFAVRHCESDIVVLLNNDTEVCNAEWLRELVSQAVRPGVGAVGAKLFYAEDRIQHAGVLLGMGPDRVAAHAFKGAHKDEVGMLARTRLVQDYHAVTAACLAVTRDKYLQVGGLDADNLAIAFNDVDFCLKLEEAGYRNVWTPYAQLYHFESYTRGYDVSEEKRARFVEERDYMLSRWREQLLRDSYYNPNLTRDFDNFSLAWPPYEA